VREGQEKGYSEERECERLGRREKRREQRTRQRTEKERHGEIKEKDRG